jgi:hypothetical protein
MDPMGLFRRLVATLFTLTLIGVTTAFILDQTLLNSDFLKDELEKTKAVESVSAVLPQEVSKEGGEADSATIAHWAGLINSEYVRAKLGDTLTALEDYYKGDGPAPVLDFSDFAARARAEGLEVPPGLDRPMIIPTQNLPAREPISNTYQTSRWGGPAAVLLLGAVLALLCWRTGNFRPLARSIAFAGAALSLIAIVLAFAPGVIRDNLHLRLFESASYQSVLFDIASQVARDVAVWFGGFGGAFLITGVATWIWLHAHEDRPRLSPRRKKKAELAKLAPAKS